MRRLGAEGGLALPLFWVGYLLAFIDRVNISFASLQMSEKLGFDARIYGLGAGCFFLGYIAFEIPSNILLQRLGGRVWIARIMITWGLLAALCAYATTPARLYTLRFLLGVGEAGFFPGVVFYLRQAHPQRRLAQNVSVVLSAAAVAGIIGGPISGALLRLDSIGGLQGWQLVFVAEGLPAVGMGILALKLLSRREPWETRKGMHLGRGVTLREVSQRLWNRNTMLFASVYFCLAFTLYGFAFWIPAAFRDTAGRGDYLTVGWLSAIPSMAALIGMCAVGWYADSSDRVVNSLRICSVIGGVASVFLCIARNGTLGDSTLVKVSLISLAFAGIWSSFGPFWALATTSAPGLESAIGIALINSIGNLGGFLSPFAIGRLLHPTRDALSLFMVLAAVAASATAILSVSHRGLQGNDTQVS